MEDRVGVDGQTIGDGRLELLDGDLGFILYSVGPGFRALRRGDFRWVPVLTPRGASCQKRRLTRVYGEDGSVRKLPSHRGNPDNPSQDTDRGSSSSNSRRVWLARHRATVRKEGSALISSHRVELNLTKATHSAVGMGQTVSHGLSIAAVRVLAESQLAVTKGTGPSIPAHGLDSTCRNQSEHALERHHSYPRFLPRIGTSLITGSGARPDEVPSVGKKARKEARVKLAGRLEIAPPTG